MADAPDPDRLKFYSFSVFTQLNGAVTAGMIHLGDKLGLFGALAAADAPITTVELAERTGLDERWVREWAYNQAAAKLIAVDTDVATPGAETFWLTPEATAVLASPDHPAFGMGMFHRFPQTMAALEAMPESFQTGVGHDYDSHGPEGAVGIERSFEPWNRHHLIPTVLPALDGIVERLETGITVADIGCGAGGAVLLMADAIPEQHLRRVRHLDATRSSGPSTGAGRRAPRTSASSTRVTSRCPTTAPIDLVTTFDCIHDMTHPQEMIGAIAEAMAPDGTWLLVDIKGRETFAENVEKNPMASLMYGISVLSCMSSALSEPGGAGLGTLGLPESKAREMAAAAGLHRFRTLDVDHSVNSFYEVRR